MTDLAGQRWHVLGAGRAGRALGAVLVASGAIVTMWTRSAQTATLARATVVGADVSRGPTPVVAEDVDVVLICVPDDAIRRVVASLGDASAPVWLHVSGALGEHVLADAGVAGAVGTCHPLQSLRGSADDAAALRGAFFGISGEPAALAAAQSLATAAGGVWGEVPAEVRVAYHLAAVIAGNGVFGILEASRAVCAAAGIEQEALTRGLAALAQQSASNAVSAGVRASLTGPVARGDAGTVQRHRRWISAVAPDLDPLYVGISERIADASGRDLPAIRVVLATEE